MVNGNYILYGGERPPSDTEIVENNNVHNRTIERKNRRKTNRSANDLQRALSLVPQPDNDTDSIKYERRVKEPRLLRYLPTTDVEDNFVNDKFETYDLKPSEEPRRHAFTKKPKNPADGSSNYAYSRSSSSCSSPNGNLPTISEHGEQYGTFRLHAPPPPEDLTSYDKKLDKYFSKPREVRQFTAKGSHPDSLYRVPTSGVGAEGKFVRAARIMRWPAALLLVCVALAVFVYFLMPDTNSMQFAARESNSTIWSNPSGAHLQPPEVKSADPAKTTTSKSSLNKTGIKTAEIDFYDSGTEVNKGPPTIIHTIPDLNNNRNLPIPPVYPSHIVPEVQYGNERADSGKGRSSKALPGQVDKQPEDSTLKPHITQKPEKPLAIYFKDGAGLTTTSSESIANAETSNIDYQGKSAVSKDQYNNKFSVANKINDEPANEKSKFYPELPDFRKQPVRADVHFTSGHSKLFGISIEDADKIKATTPTSVYNTRVSPTLPVLRDLDDTTTKYPAIINADASDVQLCSSTQLPMCRGVLPYDLTSASSDVPSLLPQFDYLISRNCSERARQFACIILEPECSPPPLKPRPPCHDLCKAVMDGCEGHIPQDLMAIMECHRYPKTKCVKPRSPCFERELTCGDGTCVPRDWICDGNKDCPGGEDEAECLKCSAEEYTCSTGECVLKRWLCDGYTDCAQGDDEVEAICVKHKIATRPEIGEESAGSAPAPAVRRPGRIPTPQHLRQIEPYRGDDSSGELLMTSDTSNPYRRNYTRRPASSRLTPYKRPIVNPKISLNDSTVETNNTDNNANPSPKQTLKEDSIEDMVLGDINFYNEYEKKLAKQGQGDKRRDINVPAPRKLGTGEYGRAPSPLPESELKTIRITRLEKNLNKLERVISGDEVMRKKSPKIIPEPVITAEDQISQEADQYNETLITAHASPCPSSELRCVDGRCITLAQLCDGTIDCSDHADEDNCFT